MSERKFQKSIPDRQSITDQESGEPNLEEQKKSFDTRLNALCKKLKITDVPVDYTNVGFMAKASLVDSHEWVQMKLGVLREAIEHIVVEEDIGNIEEALDGWETYEMPLQK